MTYPNRQVLFLRFLTNDYFIQFIFIIKIFQVPNNTHYLAPAVRSTESKCMHLIVTDRKDSTFLMVVAVIIPYTLPTLPTFTPLFTDYYAANYGPVSNVFAIDIDEYVIGYCG